MTPAQYRELEDSLPSLTRYISQRVEDTSADIAAQLSDEMWHGNGLLDAKGKPIRAQEPMGISAWIPTDLPRGDQ